MCQTIPAILPTSCTSRNLSMAWKLEKTYTLGERNNSLSCIPLSVDGSASRGVPWLTVYRGDSWGSGPVAARLWSLLSAWENPRCPKTCKQPRASSNFVLSYILPTLTFFLVRLASHPVFSGGPASSQSVNRTPAQMCSHVFS